MTDQEIYELAMAGTVFGRGVHQMGLMRQRIRELENGIAERNYAIVGLLQSAQQGVCPSLSAINKAREALGWGPLGGAEC